MSTYFAFKHSIDNFSHFGRLQRTEQKYILDRFTQSLSLDITLWMDNLNKDDFFKQLLVFTSFKSYTYCFNFFLIFFWIIMFGENW